MDAWTLPGFEVEQLLGAGATGEVWRARDLSTGEAVALKRVRPGSAPGAAEALHREAELLTGLDTPYVLRLREVVGDVLVLDLATGGSLAALLARRGTLAPGEVVTVAAPLASALAVAHARGIVHGDVSPANVLFTAEGMPLLADLGAGRRWRLDHGDVAGTAEYLDPLVAAGGPPGPSSDVWALAALCHHMLAGSPPHDGRTTGEVLGAAVKGARAPLGLLAPHACRALVAVVESALSTAPERRPAAAAFGVALQRAQAAAPVSLSGGALAAAPLPDERETHAVPRPAPPEPPPPARRRPGGWATACASLVSVLLVAGLLWARSGVEQVGPAQTLPLAATPAPPGPVPGMPAPPGPAAVASAPAVPEAPAEPGSATPTTDGADPPAAPAGRGPAGTPCPVAVPASSPPDWTAVLRSLDDTRERAFARGDPALLGTVYAPGGSAGRADADVLGALVAAGRTATGVRHEVTAVVPLSSCMSRARMQVTDVLTPQVVRDTAGARVQERPGRGQQTYTVSLVLLGGGWHIEQVGPVVD